MLGQAASPPKPCHDIALAGSLCLLSTLDSRAIAKSDSTLVFVDCDSKYGSHLKATLGTHVGTCWAMDTLKFILS